MAMTCDCLAGKSASKRVKVGEQYVGIAGFDEIVAKALEQVGSSDAEQKKIVLRELKERNYIPEGVEKDYLAAVWAEYRQVRAKHLGQVEEQYHGIPREEIPWHPTVDSAKCTGCGLCVKFCKKGVYTLEEKAVVTNPYRCVVSCTGCLTQCKEGALSFPSLIELREAMKDLRKRYEVISQ